MNVGETFVQSPCRSDGLWNYLDSVALSLCCVSDYSPISCLIYRKPIVFTALASTLNCPSWLQAWWLKCKITLIALCIIFYKYGFCEHCSALVDLAGVSLSILRVKFSIQEVLAKYEVSLVCSCCSKVLFCGAMLSATSLYPIELM